MITGFEHDRDKHFAEAQCGFVGASLCTRSQAYAPQTLIPSWLPPSPIVCLSVCVIRLGNVVSSQCCCCVEGRKMSVHKLRRFGIHTHNSAMTIMCTVVRPRLKLTAGSNLRRPVPQDLHKPGPQHHHMLWYGTQICLHVSREAQAKREAQHLRPT